MPTKVHDELLDRLGDLYRKYPFRMTFCEFLEMVITRMEERYRNQLSPRVKNDREARMDKGIRPYDPQNDSRERR
jgi:hypothetical protein